MYHLICRSPLERQNVHHTVSAMAAQSFALKFRSVTPLQPVSSLAIKINHALDPTYELILSEMVFKIFNPRNYCSSKDKVNNKLTTVDHHAPRLAFDPSNCNMQDLLYSYCEQCQLYIRLMQIGRAHV